MIDLTESRSLLVEHLSRNALRTDGPFELSSGGSSEWYLDGRQTTFSGDGARLVGRCVNAVLQPEVSAVGGLTMGADPVATATVVVAERNLRAFSVRKVAKEHGTGGRLVGPVRAGDAAAVVDDTTTTGRSLEEAAEVLRAHGVRIVQAIVVVDRSDGAAAKRMETLGVPFVALVEPADLGVV